MSDCLDTPITPPHRSRTPRTPFRAIDRTLASFRVPRSGRSCRVGGRNPGGVAADGDGTGEADRLQAPRRRRPARRPRRAARPPGSWSAAKPLRASHSPPITAHSCAILETYQNNTKIIRNLHIPRCYSRFITASYGRSLRGNGSTRRETKNRKKETKKWATKRWLRS